MILLKKAPIYGVIPFVPGILIIPVISWKIYSLFI